VTCHLPPILAPRKQAIGTRDTVKEQPIQVEVEPEGTGEIHLSHAERKRKDALATPTGVTRFPRKNQNTLGDAMMCEVIALPASILAMPIDKIGGHW